MTEKRSFGLSALFCHWVFAQELEKGGNNGRPPIQRSLSSTHSIVLSLSGRLAHINNWTPSAHVICRECFINNIRTKTFKFVQAVNF